MADISKIQLSDNTQYNLKDAVARSLLTENDTSTGDISKIQLSDNTQYNIKDAQARQDIETVTTDVKAQVNADKDLINGGNDFIDDETLDDYDDKIEEMQEAYKKFIPIQTTSGTEIQLDNSNNDKVLVDIGLEGNTEQETTTGKNLLKYQYSLGYSTKINGVTWTINQDGSITADGTASSLSIFTFATGTEIASLVGQTIKFNGTPTGTDVDIFLGLYNSDWSTVGNVYAGEDKTMTITSNATRVLARVGSGKTANKITFYPMMRLSSVTDATYEPYTGRNCLT